MSRKISCVITEEQKKAIISQKEKFGYKTITAYMIDCLSTGRGRKQPKAKAVKKAVKKVTKKK